jgi:hypothetical protein
LEIERADLERSVGAGILSPAQADAVWASLGARPGAPEPLGPAPEPPRGLLRDVGTVALSLADSTVAGLLLFAAWERYGSGAGALLASVGAAALFRMGAWVSRRSFEAAASVHVAAGIAAVAAAVYGLRAWAGLAAGADPTSDTLAAWVAGDDFPAILAAVVAAALAIRAYRLPFLSAVLVATLWFLAIDVAPVIFGPSPAWDQRALLSAAVGLLAIGAGVALDGRTRRDHSFWIYLAGLVALCGALASARSTSSVAIGGVVNGALVASSLLLRRRTFAVFGAFGLADVGGRLAMDGLVEAAVPAAVALLGVAAAAGAVAYRRFECAWSGALRASFPEPLRRLLPPAAARR